MSLLIRSCVALLLTVSLPLSAAPAPTSAQFLPPDDLTLRDAEPEQQQLLQVTEYSVVVGKENEATDQGHLEEQAEHRGKPAQAAEEPASEQRAQQPGPQEPCHQAGSKAKLALWLCRLADRRSGTLLSLTRSGLRALDRCCGRRCRLS